MPDLQNVRINSEHPCLIIYLIDQSGSMSDKFGNGDYSKAQELSNHLNKIINEIGLRCIDNGKIKNRFELAFIGYGSENDKVKSAWEGHLSGRWVVSISEVFDCQLGVDEEGQPFWIKSYSEGNTPMKKAFENAKRLCSDWINYGNHRESYPPIIINISDGAATDAGFRYKDLKREIERIKMLRTNFGAVNIFNIHISSAPGDGILFPVELSSNSDEYAQILFEISTPLNENMVQRAQNIGRNNIRNGSIGYVYNGNVTDLLNFLNITSDPL